MNIFYLDECPRKAAIAQVDKHVVKMPLETCQMLLVNLTNINHEYPFNKWKKSKAFLNHPCSIWARTSKYNYEWLCMHGIFLCNEYTYRYDKIHACQEIIYYCLDNTVDLFPDIPATDPALAMPDEFKDDDPVKSYRNYYLYGKQHLHNWKKRPPPEWYINNLNF